MRAASILLCLFLSTAASAESSTPTPIPPAALAPPVAADAVASKPRSKWSKAAPWFAAGAGALAIGGAVLWLDGARISDDLNARFRAGELDASDGPRYGRARRETIAGQVMVAGAAVLGALAVALW